MLADCKTIHPMSIANLRAEMREDGGFARYAKARSCPTCREKLAQTDHTTAPRELSAVAITIPTHHTRRGEFNVGTAGIINKW